MIDGPHEIKGADGEGSERYDLEGDAANHQIYSAGVGGSIDRVRYCHETTYDLDKETEDVAANESDGVDPGSKSRGGFRGGR